MRGIKKDPGKGKKVLQSIPIPGWLFTLVTVVYCEVLLHLWTMDGFSFGRFAAVVLFALGFGGLLGQIAGFIGHKKWGKWITVALAAVVSVLYIVEYFVNDAYRSFMPMRMLLGGAKGVTTDFGGVVVSLVLNGFWRILVMLLPALLYALLARPVRTTWKTRWFLLAGAVAAYLLGFGVVRGVGADAARLSDAYNFDSAVRVFGLNIAIPLDAVNGGESSEETPGFLVVEPVATPTEAPPAVSTPVGETAPAETEPAAYGDNVMDIDFDDLIASTGNSHINAISQYVASLTPSKKNEYTGMFAGKNLILITAEAFSKQVIDPELTPTLYRMATKGIQFTDYYQPAWGGSTTTGEFSNVTGLVPADVGMCMKQAVYQDLFLTMGHQLQKQNYYSAAYHNHNADYYDRNKTHTKLGYDRFLARYGGLEGITPVWPESDLEMIDISVPQYIDQQPFSIYYMTVSGHCGYSLKDNAMSRKNYDLVDYDGSEAVKCYLASQLELEKAMESLIRQLKEAGIADDTVIVISPDHYPYGLERSATWKNAKNYLKELYGVTEMNRFSRDNNALIIWSGCLEDKNLKVETPVYSLDILPTLSNLFGLDYDSRLLVGRDVFSDTEPLVLWPEFSWKTDKGTYEAESRTFTPAEGADVEDGYVERIKAIVSNKISYSREVQNMKYFQVLSDYLNGK